jgi:putative ABC transport system ATP-binding protein
VSFEIQAGEFVALRGPSGCGKSTLLHIVGGMDRPTAGEVHLHGRRLDALDPQALAEVRRRHVGFVFQAYNLLPTLTASENVALPLALDGVRPSVSRERAERALDEVGLRRRSSHLPSQLSGGEMQRVAVARALAIEPDLLVADEPTGSLDSENGTRVLELLSRLNKTRNLTILMATHAAEAAACASRQLNMRDGRLETGETRAVNAAV